MEFFEMISNMEFWDNLKVVGDAMTNFSEFFKQATTFFVNFTSLVVSIVEFKDMIVGLF